MSLRRTIARTATRIDHLLNLMFARKLVPTTENTTLALAGNTSRSIRRRAAAANRANTEKSVKFGTLSDTQAKTKAFLDSTDDALLSPSLIEHKAKLANRTNVLTADQVRQLELHIAKLEAGYKAAKAAGSV